MYFKKIDGDRIFLSPIDINDTEKYVEWLSDWETSINLTLHTSILTVEKEREFLRRLSNDDNNFAIIVKENNTLIGNCGFLNISNTNRTSEVGIFIGNKDYWNKGYGTEAMKLLLDYGFNVRNFNNIMLRVKSFNLRAIKCYEKCGFKYIGKRREAHILGNEKYDEIFMDILADEFNQNNKSRFIVERNN